MTTSFLEYVIEKKLVPSDQLVEALIDQIRSIPSTAELIFDQKILTAKSILEILLHQQRENSDFRGSAQALALWSIETETRVKIELQKIRRPLGEILVEKGFLDLKALTSALDSYIEISNRDTSISSPAAKSAENPENIQQILSPNLHSGPPEALDSSLAEEYTDNFSSRIGPAIKEVVSRLSVSSQESQEVELALRKGLAEFVAIRAAAGFIGAKLSESIANSAVKLIEKLLSQSLTGIADAVKNLMNSAFDLLDGIAQCIKDFQYEPILSEDPVINDLNNRFMIAQKSVASTQSDAVA